MEIKEVIVLAGGLGTRLRATVPDLPKCMALINGKPFLQYLITYLKMAGIEKYIFALGYKHEMVEHFLNKHLSKSAYKISVEAEPLGTGGAIKAAAKFAEGKHAFITNGDTFFTPDLKEFSAFHFGHKGSCSICLKQMKNIKRFGTVELDKDNRIVKFREKQYFESGLINGGIYALDISEFLQKNFPMKFSFEKEYLEKFYEEGKFYGKKSDAYFIDIGIPEDYNKAQAEFKNWMY